VHHDYTYRSLTHVSNLQGIYVVTAWFFAWTSDGILRGRRWVWMIFTSALNAVVVITLANIDVSKHIPAHFFLYCA
jgi:ACS family pantothenate transporter-like MFS transporter